MSCVARDDSVKQKTEEAPVEYFHKSRINIIDRIMPIHERKLLILSTAINLTVCSTCVRIAVSLKQSELFKA